MVVVSKEIGCGILIRTQREPDDADRSSNVSGKPELQPRSQDSGQASVDSAGQLSFPDLNTNPVLETDVEGRVLYANPAASENMLGVAGQERTHPLAADLELVISHLLEGKVPFVTRNIEDGGRSYEQKIVHVPENGSIRIYSIETTEVRRMERALRIAGDETRILAEENDILAAIGRIIASSLDINEVYAGFAEQLGKLVPFDRITISLLNLEEGTFANAYAAGVEILGREVGRIVPLGGTATNECVLARTGLIIQGTSGDLVQQFPQIIANLPSVLMSPMFYRDELVGVLHARSKNEHAYTQQHLNLLDRVAAQITPTVANSLMYAERVRSEEKLIRSNADLEMFAYAASHDLQEPLRMISSYLELLQGRYAELLDHDGVEFINFAVDGAERMKALINEILEYSKVEIQAIFLAPTSCMDVVERAILNLGASTLENRASVEFDDLPIVNADSAQLTRLFQNIIGNAIKYRGQNRPVVRIGADRSGDVWIISIEDNGIGIAPEYHERIFEMFNRLHSRGKYEGTGIGLALCSKIVQRHGGRIWVESEVGKGSTFRFTLPAIA